MNQKQRDALLAWVDVIEDDLGLSDEGQALREAFAEPEPVVSTEDALTPEHLGRVVRAAWVDWCREQGVTAYRKVCPYDEMPDRIKDVDNRIGVAVMEYVKRAAKEEGR